MKREADAEMGPSQKRTRSGDDVDIRLLIPSKAAGSVIGKGGHNITKLRTEYKASVTVPDCPGPERILTVVAGVDTALEVIEEVIPCLEDSRGQGGNRSDEVDLRMLVHQSQAGCIIGKSGFKIKELREKTGARIRIYSDCCPQSTDRVVQIQGRSNTCVECLREIMSLVRNSPVKGINNPYDPHNFDEYYAGEYGGYGDPSGKSGGGRGGPSMRGMGVPPPMGGRGGGNRFGPGGMGGPPPGGMGMGGRGGMRGGMNNDGGGYGGGYGGPPGGGRNMSSSRGGGGGFSSGGRGGYGGGNDDHSEWAEDTQAQNLLASGPKTSTQVTIPKDLAGAIIGKGGARIRKIRSDSGAGITIDEPLPGSNDRVITITGTSNQIQMAQYLLQQSCGNKNKEHAH